MPKADVRTAVLENMDLDDVKALLDDVDTEEEEDPEASARAAVGDGGSEAETATSTEIEAEPGNGTAEEPPMVWAGVDLSDLPPEKRQSAIDRFEQQEKTIREANEEKARLRKEAEKETPPPPDVQEVTDDDLLMQLGFGEDHPYREVAQELTLPLVKEIASLRTQLQEQVEEREVEKYTTHWSTRLDELEAEYGPLPVDREDLLASAVEQGIFNPDDAYARAMLSSRKLQAVVDKERQEVFDALKEKKRASGGSTRHGGERTSSSEKLESTNIRDAIKEAMKKTAKEQSFDWKEFQAAGLDME